jgi:hypothetical protein
MTQENPKDIFTTVLEGLSEEDQALINRYMNRARQVKHLGSQSPTDAVEAIYEEIPGVKDALGRYDKEIARIRKSRQGNQTT